jgi:hypothetical protein
MGHLARVMLCVLACAATAWAEPDRTETSRLYDAKGRYQGRIVERDGDARMYDATGRYQGRIVEKPGKDAVIYDEKGRFQGRITR